MKLEKHLRTSHGVFAYLFAKTRTAISWRFRHFQLLFGVMIHRGFTFPAAILAMALSIVVARSEIDPIAQRPWTETRTAHFIIYSCGPSQEVFRLGARLEQFREAYAQLAGPQAVTSPPIIVMAFPDFEAMRPFLPLYQGKPMNLAGFFKRGSDENLITLTLSGNSGSLQTIFHEYAHLLLRQNDRFWPPWLSEGMAEIYSTFDAAGHEARFGLPIPHHLRFLAQNSFMPLKDLFAVTHDSPQYNESEHQGIFYAESWLLTHYLMLGGNPAYKARFKNLTAFLRLGQKPEQAFANAFGTPLSVMEQQLHDYLANGRFDSINFTVKSDLSSARGVVTRPIARVEICFHLGNELLRIDRLDSAGEYFTHAKSLAPANPLPYEGLGLLAAQREKPDDAIHWLHESFQHGSKNFLTHYLYARELYRQTAGDGHDHYKRLDTSGAEDIRAELQKSLALMPDFAPAHELLGFFEMVQGSENADAEQHLLRAIQLEPGDQWYVLTLAQAQMADHNLAAARRTLEPLRLPYVESKLRNQADKMYQQASSLDKP